jgi:glycosyltransferase involved in cell wall biosynthesis
MTRVLLVHQPIDGGVGRHVRDLAHGLADRGYEIVLCGPGLPEGVAAEVGHRHLALQRAIDPRTDLAAAARFAQIVCTVRPDIVHAHSSKAGAVARLARLCHPRIPLLYSPHLYAFAGHFDRALERRAYREVERLLALAATRVVCVCEAAARLARSVGPRSRVRIVYNGIAPAGDGPVDPRIGELSASGPVIGALALLHPRKGLRTLIDATPDILARNPRAQVAIVGDGPDLDALTARAHQRGVDHAVHFLGPSDEPLSALRGMGVFVHPSWAEAFPYVILEAMSLGLPIVATDVGGIGEALEDGRSGLLVPPHDATALAHALNDLLEHPDDMARMGSEALGRLNRQFSLTAMIAHMAEVYEEVAPAPRGSAPPGVVHTTPIHPSRV